MPLLQGILIPISSKKINNYMHHPTDRIVHTTTFVVDQWLERTLMGPSRGIDDTIYRTMGGNCNTKQHLAH